MEDDANWLLMENVSRLDRREFLSLAGRAAMTSASLAAVLAACGPAGVSQEAKKGGTLTVQIPGDIDNFDPAIQRLTASLNIAYNVFDQLVQYNEQNNLEGRLAQKWDVTDRVWAFHLRSGVKFHNGDPFSSEAVKFSIERILDPKTGSTWKPKLSSIEKVEAPDPGTVIITTNQPHATLLDDLSWGLTIVNPKTIDTVSSKPIGTGPFLFDRWIPNDKIILKRNPNYWDPNVPQIDQLILKPLTDPKVAVNNLQAGTVDVVTSLSVVDMQSLQNNSSVRVIRPAWGGTDEILFIPSHNKALGDKRVRQALAYALDKDAINKSVYFGLGTPTSSFVPKRNWAYVDLPGYSYDLDKARSLLQQSGYGSGFSLEVIVPSGFDPLSKEAEIWQAGLKQIGVQASIKTMELNAWVDKLLKNDYDASMNVYPGFFDPSTVLSNHAFVWEPVYKSLGRQDAVDDIQNGVAAIGQDARKPIYRRIQEDFIDEVPAIFVVEVPFGIAASKRVQGLAVTPRQDLILRKVTLAS